MIIKNRTLQHYKRNKQTRMYLTFSQIVCFPLILPGSPTPKCYTSSEEIIFTRKRIP